MIVYISIGNSDDKLLQWEWSLYIRTVDDLVVGLAPTVHGNWRSLPDDPWQNACWCVEFPDLLESDKLKESLASIAATFRQDSIAWAIVEHTEFLREVRDQ